MEGEPPLLEGTHLNFPIRCFSVILNMGILISAELGINFSHIRAKSMTVLNPISRVDERIMDDADLAGPIIVLFCFGMALLFVSISSLPQRGCH